MNTTTRYLRTVRLELSGSKVVFAAAAVFLMANLSALIDLLFHPDIPYLDEEHLIVGGITALLTAVLFAILTMYLTNLRISERRLRSLFDVSTDFIHILDTRGVILRTNQAVVDKSGYRKHELIGHGISEFFTQSSQKIFEKQFPVLMERGSNRAEVEFVFKDGGIHVMDCQAIAMRDRDGKITSLMAVQRDITERQKTAAELVRVGTEWKRTFDSIPDLVSIIDTQYRLMRINKALSDKLDVKPEEVIGSFCYKVMHGLDSPPSYCPLDQMLKDGQERSTEIYEKRIGGDFFITHSLLRDADGRMFGAVHVCRDINERKRTEKALQESENKFRALAEKSLIGIYLVQDELFRYVNPKLAEIFGYTIDELSDKKGPVDLVFPEDWPIVKENLRKRLSGETASIHYEFRGVKKDGEVIQVEVFGSKTDYEGLPAVIGTLLDISERQRAEEQLRESEEKYKNLVELSTDMIYISGKEGNQTFMNDAAFNILEYAPEEVIGKPVLNLIHPDDRKKTWEKRMEMIERNIDVFNFENRYLTKSGKEIFVLHNVRVRRDERGDVIGTQGIAHDITELKRSEEKLRLFSAAVEEAPDGVQIVDLNGHVSYSNRTVEHMYGFSRDEFRGIHVSAMNADPEFADRVILPAMRERGRWDGELMVKHKEGRIFPIWLTTSLVKDDRGKPIAMVGIIRDITERKRLEEALRRSEKKFREVTSSLDEGLYVLDEQGCMTYLNPAAEKLVGWTEAELLNKKMHDIIHCRKPDGTPLPLRDCPILTVIKTGATYASDKEVFIRKDGTLFPISIRSSPIIEDGAVVACVTAFQDITQRKQTEEERERLVAELREALDKIKTLRGLIPICASCKKIRDDKGYWNQVESYVSEHSLAEFSHGICPDCAKKLYPEYYTDDDKK